MMSFLDLAERYRPLQDEARALATRIAPMSVEADNLPALRLYRRQGFAPLLVLQAFELPL